MIGRVELKQNVHHKSSSVRFQCKFNMFGHVEPTQNVLPEVFVDALVLRITYV